MRKCMAFVIVTCLCAGGAWADATYDFVLVNQYINSSNHHVFEYDLVVENGQGVTFPITDIHFKGPVISPGGIIITPPPGWLLDGYIQYEGAYYFGNVVAGSLATRFGQEEGTPLQRSILEYYYKDDALGDPMVTEEHIAAFGWASQEEMHDIADYAIRVNDFLCGLFAAVGIRLVDFKLEFGRLWEDDFSRIILADEISPDGCRLWDMKSNEKLDKDRFRRDLGGLLEAYTEVAKRLGIMSEGERPQGSGPVLVKG